MKFEENDGSLVGQVDVCDVGDEIPHEAIGRMGVGFFRPIKKSLMVEREGLCSTQVEPSPSQDQLVVQEPPMHGKRWPSSSSRIYIDSR
jgi:hypothetical protein